MTAASGNLGESGGQSSAASKRPSRTAQHDDLPLSMAGPHNPWLIAVIVSIATFMEVLDTSIANVSLTHIAGELSVTLDESTWVLTSYLVSNAIILPISGWLATVIGRKRFYMSCVALFTFSSMCCGLAPSLPWLIFFRVLQGMGGGGLAPSEQAILHDSFPQRKWGPVFALYGLAVVFAPAIGPTLGGWITDNFSWHWVFLINVPVGAFSLLLSHLFLNQPEAETRQLAERSKRKFRVDYIGFGLVALGLGTLQVVLDKGERDDWFESNFIAIFAVVAVVSLALLVIYELRHRDPIVDVKLFKDRGFAASNAVMFAVGFILFGTTQLLPQMTQELFGYTSTRAGLVITPGGLALILFMPVAGILTNKIQPRYLIGFGLVAEAGALWHMTHLSLDAAYIDIALARAYQTVGLPFLFVSISTVAYVGIPKNKSNEAAAFINLSRNLGGSFGISLVQTLLARRTQFHQTRLVSHLTPFDPIYTHRLQSLAGKLAASGVSTIDAKKQALAQIVAQMQQQAAILSYLDVFHALMIGAFCMVPLIFVLRHGKSNPSGGH